MVHIIAEKARQFNRLPEWMRKAVELCIIGKEFYSLSDIMYIEYVRGKRLFTHPYAKFVIDEDQIKDLPHMVTEAEIYEYVGLPGGRGGGHYHVLDAELVIEDEILELVKPKE